jgi:hypothetical protein
LPYQTQSFLLIRLLAVAVMLTALGFIPVNYSTHVYAYALYYDRADADVRLPHVDAYAYG